MLEHYVKWVESMPWNIFATLTTAYEMKPAGWRRRMEIFHPKLTYQEENATMLWVVEKGGWGGKFHIHALIKSALPPMVIHNIWQDSSVYQGQESFREDGKVFNRTRIEKRKKGKKAAAYIFKDARYTMKDLGKFDWNIHV